MFAYGEDPGFDLAECAERGESLWELPGENPVVRGIDDFLEQAGLG